MPQIDYSTASIQERKRRANELLSNLFQILEPKQKIDNPLDFLANELCKKIFDPGEESYLKNTKFADYRDALLEIVKITYRENRQKALTESLADMPEDDIFAIFQNMQKLNQRLTYLDKNHKTINKKVIDSYFSLYPEISNFFERVTLQLFGLKRILDGESITYSQLKLSKLSDYVNSLKTRPFFSELVQPMNITVRNAIVHGGNAVNPITRTIKFTDKRASVTMSYEDFIQATRELASATYVISHLDSAIKCIFINFIRSLPN
ncbi:hypothetical protein NTE_02097 [Candidatus Nitrososphaera evergladensis SR1]|uniref:Uncharacterized protein n=2 Tax=Nitrososphaera TaxID=497726 RepID=A0A075MTQ6_9ARCH|nr:hypothetical protein NTE_02097 [Candidatus Nitrososphaera evergladensis SR1]